MISEPVYFKGILVPKNAKKNSSIESEWIVKDLVHSFNCINVTKLTVKYNVDYIQLDVTNPNGGPCMYSGKEVISFIEDKKVEFTATFNFSNNKFTVNNIYVTALN